MSALTMSSSASTSTPLSSQHGGGGRSTQVQSHLFIDAVLASPAAFGYGTGASVSVVDQHADQQHQASASLLTPDLASLSMSSHRRGSTSSALYAYSSASSSPSLVATASHPTVTTLPAAASHHDLAKVPVPSSPPSGQFLETSDWLTRASVQQNQDQGFGQQQHHQRRHSVHHLPFQYQASSLPSPARPRHDNQATPTPTPTPTPTSIDWIFEQQQQQGQCLADPIATQSQSQTQNQNQQTAAAGSSDAFNFNMPPFFTTLDSASVPSAAAADQHELVHTSVLNPASSAAQAPLPLPVESTQMLLGSGAAHSTEGLLNSLDVSAPMPMPQSQPQGNSFDIDALLAQAAADAHFELAQQQQQQQHQSQSQSQSQSQVLIPVTCVTDPSAFAVQDSVPFALDCHQAAASRKRKRCVGANPGGPSCSSASTSTSSSPDLVAVTWHHQPPPAAPLLASHAHVPVMDPSTAPSMAALTFPIPSPGLATSHTVTDPMVAAHTSPTMMATTVDSSAPGPIPALCKSMPNPTAPAAGAGVIADTVLGRLRVGQRRDYTVSRSPATSPSMRASDMMGEEATRLGACSRRRPSLPTIVEGHTVSARTRMDSGYVPDLDLHPYAHVRGFSLPELAEPIGPASAHVRTMSMPNMPIMPIMADGAEHDSQPQVLEIKFACEVGGMEPVKRRKMRKGKGGRKVPTASDAATGDAETECTSADEGDGDGRQQVFRRRGSTSSESSVDHVARAAADGDNKCPACDLPEGTLMRSSPLLCQACVAKRKRAVEAATRAFLDKHRGKMSECIACHEVKSVVHDFSRLGMEYRRICKRCDYKAQKERKKKQMAAKEADLTPQVLDAAAAAQDTPQVAA